MAKQNTSSESEHARSPRKRAPRRQGDRTTLRVPKELQLEAERLAPLLGTTPNDVLIRFAERGALFYAQEVEMVRAAELQMAAILDAMGPVDPEAEYPSEAEARAAAFLLRSGKFGPV